MMQCILCIARYDLSFMVDMKFTVSLKMINKTWTSTNMSFQDYLNKHLSSFSWLQCSKIFRMETFRHRKVLYKKKFNL